MENIYIKAMEIGNQNPNGIIYEKMLEQIKTQLKEPISKDSEYALIDWILDSFTVTSFSETGHNSVRGYLKGLLVKERKSAANEDLYSKLLDSTLVMKGKTAKQYIDYLELKESREQANRAYKTSLISIAIAVISVIASTLFSWYLSANSPQLSLPPYEVKIIEDKTSTPLLEEEIKQLKEQLVEAEMMINIYEEENSKKARLKK